MKKIIICGGHLTPALALIDKFKNDNVKIVFVGRKYSTEGSKNISKEFNQISSKKIKFLTLTTGRLQRHFTRYTITSLFKVPIGFVQSIYFLAAERPHLVVSFGGYISTPVVTAAWLLGIPSITHEQASRIGLANKINSIFVTEFLSAWPLAKNSVKKVNIIGNLTRKEIFKTNIKNKKLEDFVKNKGEIIYVTGGNLGSHFINQVIFKSVNRLSHFYIVHQLGTANFKGDHEKAKKINKHNYLPIPYIADEDIGGILNRAYLVVSRSGANTIWELALLAKIAVLVPLPISASREQQTNANILSKAGSAVVIDQREFNPETLMLAIAKVKKNYRTYHRKALILSKNLNRDAATKMRESILKYIEHA